jgi:hypothetical protein
MALTGTKIPPLVPVGVTNPFFPLMPTPGAEKMSKKINENNKNFKIQNPFTCMYLTQPSIGENLNLIYFLQKDVILN